MNETRCFTLTPLPRARRVLRRHQMLRRGYDCPAAHLVLGRPIRRHQADRALDEVDHAPDAPRLLRDLPGLPEGAWPERCQGASCPEPGGYVFLPDDPRLVVLDRLYARSDGGEPAVLSAPPPGAVWDAAPWVPPGEDGLSLAVALPGGSLWFLDAPLPGGEAFRRAGEPGALTVEQVSGPTWPWRLRAGVITPA